MSKRAILSLTGPDRFKLLQGLVTNDVGRLEKNPSRALYAALLTPQGKLIVDFFLISEGDAILIDVDAREAEALLKRLTMYKLRSDAALAMTDRTVSRGIGAVPEGAFADPRHAALGWRAYDGRASQGVDWGALRVENGVPALGAELSSDSFILEMGFERLNGVDFKKGCYVGQEVTARMKHKTELRKGLAIVEIDGTAPVGTTLKTVDGKDAGTLFTQSNGRALAYLRFDRAKAAMKAADATVVWPNL